MLSENWWNRSVAIAVIHVTIIAPNSFRDISVLFVAAVLIYRDRRLHRVEAEEQPDVLCSPFQVNGCALRRISHASIPLNGTSTLLVNLLIAI
jgi:hypothetical protein